MPLDPSIPLQAKAPEFNPLAQALQVSQLRMLNANGAQLQQQIDANRATSGAYQQATDPATGQIDDNKLIGLLSQDPRAAYNLPQVMKGIQDLKTSQQGLARGQIGLNNDQIDNYKKAMGFMSQQFATLDPNDPDFNAKMLSIGADAVKLGHIDPNMVVSTMQQIPQDPAQRSMWFKQKLNAMQDFTAQLSNLKPQTGSVSTGGATQFTNTDPLTGKVTTTGSVQNTVAPTQREEIQSDALGNRYIVQRGEKGEILNTRQVPGSYNAVTSAPGTGPANLPPGGVGAIDDAQKEVTAARAVANQAPVMHDLNRSIIAEVDKGLNTGSLGQLTQKVASATGYSFGMGEKATDYNVLGKLLERSALSAAQAMGPHTNAGLEAARAANGGLDYTPQAIRKIAVLNDALTSGAEHYRSGLEQALQASGQNPAVKRSFDQQWAQNFDPRIMRLENASQSGDKNEIAAVLKEVGGTGSKGAKDLMTKAQRLNQLISQGHL